MASHHGSHLLKASHSPSSTGSQPRHSAGYVWESEDWEDFGQVHFLCTLSFLRRAETSSGGFGGHLGHLYFSVFASESQREQGQ